MIGGTQQEYTIVDSHLVHVLYRIESTLRQISGAYEEAGQPLSDVEDFVDHALPGVYFWDPIADLAPNTDGSQAESYDDDVFAFSGAFDESYDGTMEDSLPPQHLADPALFPAELYELVEANRAYYESIRARTLYTMDAETAAEVKRRVAELAAAAEPAPIIFSFPFGTTDSERELALRYGFTLFDPIPLADEEYECHAAASPVIAASQKRGLISRIKSKLSKVFNSKSKAQKSHK